MNSDLAIDERTIENLVQAIVKLARPTKVILFGSAARGVRHRNSDIDLLVVVPDGTPRRKTAQSIYRNVTTKGVPFDLVVATTTDLQNYGDKIGLIYRNILRDGITVYG